MVEIRPSLRADIPDLKVIWKVCFGDDDIYIDFFFENQYTEDKTFVLLYDKEIAAMLTIIPTQVVMPNKQSYSSSMLYAIATHSRHQGKGFSTQIMDYTKKYLLKHNVDILTLVPASKSLIDFYGKRGYRAGFYINESTLIYEMIAGSIIDEPSQLTIVTATPQVYNSVRNQQLQGRYYIAYDDVQIAYQKKLSIQSGADIYIFDIGHAVGCAAIERITRDKVIIKEMLIPEYLIYEGLLKIIELFPASEYILRLPAYIGGTFGGFTRVFGMIQPLKKLDMEMTSETSGYLGFAYD